MKKRLHKINFHAKKIFKKPLIWSAIFFAVLLFLFATSLDFKGMAQTSPNGPVMGQGIAHYLAKWTGTTAVSGPTLIITPSSATIAVNGTQQYTAMYDPDGPGPQPAEDVTSCAGGFSPCSGAAWSIANSSIARISVGLVTGVSQGTTQITAVYQGLTATASVTVSGAPAGGSATINLRATLNGNSWSGTVNGVGTFITDTFGPVVTFYSSNSSSYLVPGTFNKIPLNFKYSDGQSVTTYAVTFQNNNISGPAGATLSSISNSQFPLNPGDTKTVTFNFVTQPVNSAILNFQATLDGQSWTGTVNGVYWDVNDGFGPITFLGQGNNDSIPVPGQFTKFNFNFVPIPSKSYAGGTYYFDIAPGINGITGPANSNYTGLSCPSSFTLDKGNVKTCTFAFASKQVACTPLTFNKNNSTFSPATVSPGATYSAQCDYGVSNIDSVNAYWQDSSKHYCTFTGWSGTIAKFNCTASSNTGTFPTYCEIKANTASNDCAQINEIKSSDGSSGPTVGTPTPGKCGSADGSYFVSAPSSNLCLYSDPAKTVTVSGSGPWSWTCYGLAAADAPCSANKGSQPVINNPPPSVSVSPGALGATCSAVDVAKFDWTYSDASGSAQTAYQIVIYDASGAVAYNSNKVASSANSYTANNLVPGTYTWKMQVWNGYNISSGWVSGSQFTIKTDEINFSWAPSSVTVNQSVTFTASNNAGISVNNFAWTFEGADSTSTSGQSVTVKFISAGVKKATLTPDGICTVSKNITVGGGGEI